MRFALNAPASPRFDVISSIAARASFFGCRSSGNSSARSDVDRSPITARSASAYGRAASMRSDARFILDVATISIVRVILRVFSTDLMRPLSSLPLAIFREARVARVARVGGSLLRHLLVGGDGALQLGLGVLRQRAVGLDLLA